MKVYHYASFQVDHKSPCFFCTDVFNLVDKCIFLSKNCAQTVPLLLPSIQSSVWNMILKEKIQGPVSFLLIYSTCCMKSWHVPCYAIATFQKFSVSYGHMHMSVCAHTHTHMTLIYILKYIGSITARKLLSFVHAFIK